MIIVFNISIINIFVQMLSSFNQIKYMFKKNFPNSTICILEYANKCSYVLVAIKMQSQKGNTPEFMVRCSLSFVSICVNYT